MSKRPAEWKQINQDIRRLRSQTMAMVGKQSPTGDVEKNFLKSATFWESVTVSVILMSIGAAFGFLLLGSYFLD